MEKVLKQIIKEIEERKIASKHSKNRRTGDYRIGLTHAVDIINNKIHEIGIMNDFKTHLINEQAQLEKRINKLDNFLMSDKIENIDDIQKALLRVQLTAMITYNQCLTERIERI